MKNNLILFVIVTVMLWSSMIGCSQHANIIPGSDEAFTKKDVMTQNTPRAVVEAAVMAGNDGKYLEVEKYLSTDCTKFYVGDRFQKTDKIRGIVDRDTRNGTVTKIIVVKEIISGDEAEVISVFHYKDGSTREDHTKMIKENGVWRISCS